MKKKRTKLKEGTQGRGWWFINGKIMLFDIHGDDVSNYYEVKIK